MSCEILYSNLNYFYFDEKDKPSYIKKKNNTTTTNDNIGPEIQETTNKTRSCIEPNAGVKLINYTREGGWKDQGERQCTERATFEMTHRINCAAAD